MFHDRYGMQLTTNSVAACDKYQQAMDSALAGNAFSEKWYEEATELDPQFAMAWVAHSENLFLQGKFTESAAAMVNAENCAPNCTSREKVHIQIIKLLLKGQSSQALSAIKNHAIQFPKDALLISKAVGGFGLFAFGGDAMHPSQRLQFMNSLSSDYEDDWWFLSLHSFALVETFQLKKGEELIEKSLTINPRNGHAAHTYTHICYEKGTTEECISYAKKFLNGYEREAHLYGHIHWHWALGELALGNFSNVLEIYENHLSPSVSKGGGLGLIADATALYWRAKLQDFELLSHRELCSLSSYIASQNLEDVTFGEAHIAMFFAQSGEESMMNALTKSIEKRNQLTPHAKYDLMKDISEGVTAFANKDYHAAIQHLAKAKPSLAMLGGSNAQREMFEDTLIKSYLQVGNTQEAAQLLQNRVERRG